jgi:hypothetical protein
MKLRFSLRTALLAVAFAGLLCAWAADHVRLRNELHTKQAIADFQLKALREWYVELDRWDGEHRRWYEDLIRWYEEQGGSKPPQPPSSGDSTSPRRPEPF